MCSSPVNTNGADIVGEQRYDQCVDGTCMCKSKWQKPTPSVYEGLGFDDCSTEVENVPNGSYKFYPDKVLPEAVDPNPACSRPPLSLQFVQQKLIWLCSQVLNYKQWSFFKFNITKHDYEVP